MKWGQAQRTWEKGTDSCGQVHWWQHDIPATDTPHNMNTYTHMLALIYLIHKFLGAMPEMVFVST